MHLARLLFWVLLPALFILVAELIITIGSGNALRWWAYVVPPVVALIGLLLLHDVLRSDTNRPLSRDEIFKIISMSGAAVVAIALTGTFFESIRRDQEKPYQQALVEQCTKVSTVLAQLASVNPWEVKPETYQAFWEQFFGPLIIVEGEGVSKAMVKLATLISIHRSSNLPDRETPKCWEQGDVISFHELTLNVVKECRKQILAIAVVASDFVPDQLKKENEKRFPFLDPKFKVRQTAVSASNAC
jgi:hypothetical protein